MTDAKTKDLMFSVSEYPTIDKEASMGTAINTLREHYNRLGDNRVLVVIAKNDSGDTKTVGVITIIDILQTLKHLTKFYDTNELSQMMHAVQDYGTRTRKHRETGLNKGFELTIREIMPREIEPVDSSCPPLQALQAMMLNNTDTLAVCEDEEIVGLVRAVDLLKYMEETLDKGMGD